MKIVNYSETTMGGAVVHLFKEIYPHWSPEQINNAVYDENTPLHVTTKIAVVDDRIVGQANIFRLKNNKSIANLGFHVHPRYQRQGIGHKLAAEVLNIAEKKSIETIVVQTEKDNIASLKLAEKLGFSEASQAFIAENTDSLKLYRLKNGIVLHKNL